MNRTRDDALTTIETIGVVPVATLDDADRARHVASALAAGGLPCIEVTLRTDAGLGAIEAVIAAHPEMLVGAGTVLDDRAAERAVDAGASFVVSPGFDDGVVQWCREHDIAVLPGVATPTEMMRAMAAGVSMAKFFPARASGGCDMLSAVRPVFPDLRFVPTGGVGPDDLGAYLELDNVAAVGGSWMVDPRLLSLGDWPGVEARAADAVRLVRAIRDAR